MIQIAVFSFSAGFAVAVALFAEFAYLTKDRQ